MSDLDNMITYIETAFENANREVEPYTDDMNRKCEENSKFKGYLVASLFHTPLTQEENRIWQTHIIKNKNRNTILRLKNILKQVLEFE